MRTSDTDRPYDRFILRPLITDEVSRLVDSPEGRAIALTPPLTADHLIRTKPLPMWIDDPAYDDEEKLKGQIAYAVAEYSRGYEEYIDRHAARLAPGVKPFDSHPRVILLPGVGAVCAGASVGDAGIARDITAETIAVKTTNRGDGDLRGAVRRTSVRHGVSSAPAREALEKRPAAARTGGGDRDRSRGRDRRGYLRGAPQSGLPRRRVRSSQRAAHRARGRAEKDIRRQSVRRPARCHRPERR